MSYEILNKSFLEGMAFGHKQSTFVISIKFSHQCLLASNPQRVLSLPINIESFKNIKLHTEMQHQLVDWLCYFYIGIQRSVNLPIFLADCNYVLSHKMGEDETYLFQLALPYKIPKMSLILLQWIMDALFNDSLSNENLMSRFISIQANLRNFVVKSTNTINLIEAAFEKNINFLELIDNTYCFGHGSSSLWLNSTLTDKSSLLGNSIAKDKFDSARVLQAYALPTAFHEIAVNQDHACKIAQKIGFPVVVKPANLDQGKGVAAGLNSEADLILAFEAARKVSNKILVEKHIDGGDFRITVLHGKVIKVMQRFAGGVIGDGKSSIGELIAISQASAQSQRVFNREGKYRLTIDEEGTALLKERGLTEESIIPFGKIIPLRRKNNISTGGSQKLISLDQVHQDNLMLACRASEVLGLDISGVDLIIPDIGKSWLSGSGVICEVNGQPQIGKTETPEIYSKILDLLMPNKGIIPLYLQITFGLSPEDQFEASLNSAKTHSCNGMAVLNQVFFNLKKETLPSNNGYEAAKRLLIDRRINAGVIAMKAEEVILYGLPTLQFLKVSFIYSHLMNRDDILFKKVLSFLCPYNFNIEYVSY